MVWTEETLEDYIDIKHGFAFKGEHFGETGEYVVLTPGNIHLEGGLKLTAKDKSYRGEFPPSYLFEKGDLVVVMTDLLQDAPILGGAFLISESNKFLHNQRLGKVAIKGNVNKLFLYYYFNSEFYRGQVRATATGATVRHTAPERIYQCKIKLPPITTQCRIAEILGRYDALIENYQLQIGILEASAQALYREWFMRGRCPYASYEHHAHLPMGWSYGRIGDLYEVKSGFAFEGALLGDTGFPVIKIANIQEGSIDLNNCDRYCGGLNKRIEKFEIFEGDLLVAMTGAQIGKVGLITFLPERYFLNQRVGKFFAKTQFLRNNAFGYFTSQTGYFKTMVENNGMGAAQPNISGNQIEKIRCIIPPDEVLIKFTDHCQPILSKIGNLQSQISSLRQLRDKILPRLLSGQILLMN